MTLMAWLAALKSDPSDGNSPTLVVGDGSLTDAQRETVVGAAYARRPYAVVVGLPRGAPTRLHNRRVKLTGGIDIHLNHPRRSTGGMPDGTTLAKLQALLLAAQAEVTELTSGYPLASPLLLVSEVDPRPETFDAFTGLTATTRFTFTIWR